MTQVVADWPSLASATTLQWRSGSCIQDIDKIAALYKRSYYCFGNEVKAIYDLEHDGFDKERLRRGRDILSRPISEPVLFENWERFRNWRLPDHVLLELASRLVGRSVRLRDGDAFLEDRPAGVRILFRRNQDLEASGLKTPGSVPIFVDPFVNGCVLYAMVAIGHPLWDGNGRLGRALIHAALAHGIPSYSAPFLPLGPVFKVHGQELTAALLHLSQNGDWSDLLDLMAQLVAMATRLARDLLA